jgi:hypothetical protein
MKKWKIFYESTFPSNREPVVGGHTLLTDNEVTEKEILESLGMDIGDVNLFGGKLIKVECETAPRINDTNDYCAY